MKTIPLRTKIFRFFLFSLIAIFLTMFFSNKYGYYEYKKREQVSLTQEQIKQFEEDVRNGKDINLEQYLENTNKNYQTKLSQLGLNASNFFANIIKKGIDTFFKHISKYIIE